jgi:hypothetical protein
MTSMLKVASIAMGALLSSGVLIAALADVPAGYAPREGTVLSTHIPAEDGCRSTMWRLSIGPSDTVRGTVGVLGTNTTWQVSGSYTSNGTFHLNRQELGGAERTGTVDAQVQRDGALVLRMSDSADPSPCHNRTVYLPWFRNGNDFDPNGGAAGGF